MAISKCTHVSHADGRPYQPVLIWEEEVLEAGQVGVGGGVGAHQPPHLVSHPPARSQEQELQPDGGLLRAETGDRSEQTGS